MDYAGKYHMTVIEAGGGRTEQNDVSDFELEATENLEPVKTMNRRARIRGFRKGISEFTGSFTVMVPVGTPEYDWHKARKNGTELLLVLERAEGGTRFALEGTRILSVGEKSDSDGNAEFSIEYQAEDYEG